MDRVQGDGFYGEQTEVLNSDQVVELGADWKIRYLMCSVVPIGAASGIVQIEYSVFGTEQWYDAGLTVDLADPKPVIFDDCIDKVRLTPVGVDGSWQAAISQAR